MDKKITKNSQETVDLGVWFSSKLKAGDVVLLYGDLGSGKTTFVQGIAKGLGISDRVLSPTFVLVRIHSVSFGNIKKLNHIDLYRVQKESIGNLGLSEIFDDRQSATVIEWADRLTGFKIKKGYKIWFENLGEDDREIIIKKLT